MSKERSHDGDEAYDMAGATSAPKPKGEKDGEEPRKSVATQLVELAVERYDLGVTEDGEAFATTAVGPRIVRMLRGGRQSLRAELAATFFEKAEMVASQAALADACSVLEGRAQQLPPIALHLRVAETKVTGRRAVVLDLGDATGRAVVVTAAGWFVVDEPPVLFRRTALTGALPEPTRGATLDDSLWPLLNIAPAYRPVLAGWLVAALLPDIPHPVLSLSGEQGTAKTSATKTISALIDPSPAQVRKAPKDQDSWVTAAAGSWVVALDNLGGISEAISDALCRASTGDGDVRRRLYSDGDLHVLAFRRVVLMNGIDIGGVQDDLADRLVTILLDRIPDSARKLDEQVTADWAAQHPRALGALLDLLASVLGVLPTVSLPEKPRMADYARVLAAVDRVQQTTGLQTYLGLRTELAEEALSNDPVLPEVARAVTEEWTGTAAQLLDAITPADEKWRAPKGWPARPRDLTTVLKRRAPSLRRLGWTVEQGVRDPVARAVTWRLVPGERRRTADDARNARNARATGEPAGQAPSDGSSDSRASSSDTSERHSTLEDRSTNARTGAPAPTSTNNPRPSDTSNTNDPSAPSQVPAELPMRWRGSGEPA